MRPQDQQSVFRRRQHGKGKPVEFEAQCHVIGIDSREAEARVRRQPGGSA
jgi:hypothetical protein